MVSHKVPAAAPARRRPRRASPSGQLTRSGTHGGCPIREKTSNVTSDTQSAIGAVLEDWEATAGKMRWRPARVICDTGKLLPIHPRRPSPPATPGWLDGMVGVYALR